jgi:leucine dehydrogenase
MSSPTLVATDLSSARSDLIMEKLPIKGYEQVLKVTHRKTKLQAIIAIHDTRLGPALGGIRIYPYTTFEQALTDALRLSEGMTYKSAVAEVGYGGGKSVILADPKKDKNEEMLHTFAEAVNSLEGMYICAEDVGCGLNDVMIIRKKTPYVVGLPHNNSSGDPGPFTAWGVFRGVQSVLKKLFGTESVKGRKILIQGLGDVGGPLAEYLFWEGADLLVCDIDVEKMKRFAHRYGAQMISVDDVYKTPCDVFSPCAMGGILNDQSIAQLRCRSIAGSANNQLLKESHGDKLQEKAILYAPDFVINAGGLLNVAHELFPDGYQAKRAREATHKIYDTLMAIYEIAEKNNISTHRAAVALANYRIQYGIGKRKQAPHFPAII